MAVQEMQDCKLALHFEGNFVMVSGLGVCMTQIG